MSRYRRLFVVFILFSGLGCNAPGPESFFRESLQARSEFSDTLTFIVDEATAAKFYPPAEKILKRRIDELREAFDAWDTKAGVRSGFDKVAREQFKPADLKGDDLKRDMTTALIAYAKYCDEIAFVNTRLDREAKRLEIVYEASLAQKIESGQAVAGGDLPALKAVLERVWNMRDWPAPRIMGRGMTKEYLAKFTEFAKLPQVDTAKVTEFEPGGLIVDKNAAPPPTRPASVAGAVDKFAAKLAEIKDRLGPEILVVYADDSPRQQSLKNETGKALRNVSGFLIAKINSTERWIPINIADWQKDPIQTQVMAIDNPTNMRLMFQAELEGKGLVAYDQKLGPIPPPKKN
jgi:hypothetical protein